MLHKTCTKHFSFTSACNIFAHF